VAMISIPVSSDVGKLFRGLDVPGNRDPSDHITMFYFDKELPIKKLVKAVSIIYEVLLEQEPFSVCTKKVKSFPKGKDGYPIIVEIDSKELVKLRNKMAKALDANKIRYSKKFPVYSPHLTLSYSKEDIKSFDLDVSWLVNEIKLYGGDRYRERLLVSFPLIIKSMEKKAAYANMLADIWINEINRV